MLYIYGKLRAEELRRATDELDPYRWLAVTDFEPVFGATFEVVSAGWSVVEEREEVCGVGEGGEVGVGIGVGGVGVLLVCLLGRIGWGRCETEAW